MPPSAYDLIVAGGSLSGLSAAYHAARGGARVLLVDPKQDIRRFRCSESVMAEDLSFAGYPPDKAWVAQEFRVMRLVAPDGRRLECRFATRRGVILRRDEFQARLAEMARAESAEIRLGVRARELDLAAGTLNLEPGGAVTAKAFVDASGLGAHLASQVIPGTGRPPAGDRAVLLQRTLKAKGLEDDVVQLLFGSSHGSPKGYSWIIPRGDGVFNVGVFSVADAARTSHLRRNLDGFIERHVGPCERLYAFGGELPLSRPFPRPLARAGNHDLLLVGDAARLTLSVLGAGIHTALISGMFAGRHWHAPRTYEKRLKTHFYKGLEWSYRMKERSCTSNEAMNRLFRRWSWAFRLHAWFPVLTENVALRRRLDPDA